MGNFIKLSVKEATRRGWLVGKVWGDGSLFVVNNNEYLLYNKYSYRRVILRKKYKKCGKKICFLSKATPPIMKKIIIEKNNFVIEKPLSNDTGKCFKNYKSIAESNKARFGQRFGTIII